MTKCPPLWLAVVVTHTAGTQCPPRRRALCPIDIQLITALKCKSAPWSVRVTGVLYHRWCFSSIASCLLIAFIGMHDMPKSRKVCAVSKVFIVNSFYVAKRPPLLCYAITHAVGTHCPCRGGRFALDMFCAVEHKSAPCFACVIVGILYHKMFSMSSVCSIYGREKLAFFASLPLFNPYMWGLGTPSPPIYGGF